MTEPRAVNRPKADIKQYVDNNGNLTSYALQRWKEYVEKRKPKTYHCCEKSGESYTIDLVAWFAAGPRYPNIEVRTSPVVMICCDFCGYAQTFAGHVVFPELKTALRANEKSTKEDG